jgi:hypothetical protein
MSNVHSDGAIEPIFGTQRLLPVKQKLGEREIEVTFLGNNADGQPTWILWNAKEPLLIGVLRQGKLGYTFEQRTSVGPMVHENLSTARVQRMLGA